MNIECRRRSRPTMRVFTPWARCWRGRALGPADYRPTWPTRRALDRDPAQHLPLRFGPARPAIGASRHPVCASTKDRCSPESAILAPAVGVGFGASVARTLDQARGCYEKLRYYLRGRRRRAPTRQSNVVYVDDPGPRFDGRAEF